MGYPKIYSVKTIDNHTLLVEFDNCEKRKYDITPLLESEVFFPLKNPAFFKNAQIEQTGYAVFWNEDIDISEYELWVHGKPV